MSTEQNMILTLGSLFDGSGGFPLGGILTGQITPDVYKRQGLSHNGIRHYL